MLTIIYYLTLMIKSMCGRGETYLTCGGCENAPLKSPVAWSVIDGFSCCSLNPPLNLSKGHISHEHS